MTGKQYALAEYHMDTAALMTGENEVFWVLDLTDEQGFNMACALERCDEVAAVTKISDLRDNILSTGCIPAQTATMKLDQANACIAMGWRLPPLRPGTRYLAIVSEGSLTVTLIRSGNPISVTVL